MTRSRQLPFLVPLMLLAAACGGDQDGPPAQGADGPASPPSTAVVGLGERVSFDGLSYAVPSRWEAITPDSSMRRAEYRIPGAEGSADGECALFYFPGTGGSVEANLQRWYGQMARPDGGSIPDSARLESFESGGMSITLVDVSGTYSGGMSGDGPFPEYRLLGGIIETDSSPWFLKCTGPEGTMEAASSELRALLESVGS